MTTHDPMCRLNLSDCDHGNTHVCHCALIDRVRADERAKVYRPDAHRMMLERDAARAEVAALKQAWDTGIKAVEYRVLADLRAKVEGLPYRTWVPPHATDCPGRPGKRGICTCGDSLRASDWMLRADVLALLEEVPNA